MIEAGGQVLDRQDEARESSRTCPQLRHRSRLFAENRAQRIGNLADCGARLDGARSRRHEVVRAARGRVTPSSAARHAAASREARTARTRSTCRRSISGSMRSTSIGCRLVGREAG